MDKQTRSSFGPAKEAKNLHVNGSASVAELKEFLGALKGRNPQEVIGIVSASLLIQSVAIATVATVLLLGVFTVGPYLVYGPPKAKEIATKPNAATPAAVKTTNEMPSVATTKADAAESKTPDVEKAAAKMGLDEVKGKNAQEAPPDIDNLLDGVE